MTIKEIRELAQEKGILLPKTKKAKKADLVHLFQHAEGNDACYATQKCDNASCLWYTDFKNSIKKERRHELLHDSSLAVMSFSL